MALTNNMLLAIALALVTIFLQSASTQYVVTCPFEDDSQQEAIVRECLSSSPELMKIVESVMASQGGPSTAMPELDDRICQNTGDIARSLNCLLEKAKQCLPLPDGDMKDTLMGLMPDEGRMKRAFDYICENKDKFTPADMQCVQPIQAQLSQCMNMEMQREMQGLNPEDTSTVKDAVCRVPKISDDCFHKNRGSCSKAMVDTVVGVVDILLPCNGAVQTGATMLLLAIAVFMSLFNNKIF